MKWKIHTSRWTLHFYLWHLFYRLFHHWKTLLSQLFIFSCCCQHLLLFQATWFLIIKRLHFCLPACIWEDFWLQAHINHLRLVAHRRESHHIHAWTFDWNVKFKKRLSNYILAPTPSPSFFFLHAFYELWRAFQPRGSGYFLSLLQNTGSMQSFKSGILNWITM